MTSKSRISRMTGPAEAGIKAPTTYQGWYLLAQKTVAKAEEVSDERLPEIRKALVEGKAEALLRKMGIISENDLVREFPTR